MATAVQKRRAFWLAGSVTESLRERALLLRSQGIEVQFFSSIDSFLRELDIRRAGIIIVSDHELAQTTKNVIQMLMNTPEIQGARMIFCPTEDNSELRMLAAVAGFRDVIPDDLEDQHWLQRVRFATASQPAEYRQPAVQATMHGISAVALPARIVWISPEKIRLECRVRPPVGSTLTLSGALAEACGVPSISMTVRAAERTNLLYRFSDALVCDWSVPASSKAHADDLLAKLRLDDPGPRCRVFVAVQNSALRREVLSRFEDPRFEISSAIQKHSIAHDPRYFAPDLVLIESTLCSLTDDYFPRMMAALPKHTAVVIFGTLANFSALRTRFAPRKMVMLSTVPRDITTSALNRFMPVRKKIEDISHLNGCYLPSESAYSIGEVSFSARLSQIHPTAASLTMPFPVSNFALLRVDAPFIRKSTGASLFLKATRVFRLPDAHEERLANLHDSGTGDMTRPDMNFSWRAEGYLADSGKQKQEQIADAVIALQQESLKSFRPTQKTSAAAGNAPQAEVSFYRIPVAVPPPPAAIKVVVPAAAQQASVQVVDSTPQPRQVVAAKADDGVSAPAAVQRAAGDGLEFEDSGKEYVRIAQRFAEPAIDTIHQEERINIRGEISPMFEAAGDLKDEFIQGLRDGVRSDVFRILASIFIVMAVLVGLLWFVGAYIAPSWQKSGSQYSDQLKELAPHLKQAPRPKTPRSPPGNE